MWRVLPGRAQPRPGTGHQLRCGVRRHDDAHPYRPAQRVPGPVTRKGLAMNSFSGIWRGLAAPIAIALVLATPVAAHAAPPATTPQAPPPAAPLATPAAQVPALAPAQGPLPQTGCTVTGTLAATCELWALTGTVVLPGAPGPVPIWGFASTGAGPATAPGPVLVVDQGTTVTVNLHNGLGSALSLAVPAMTGLAPDTAGPR